MLLVVHAVRESNMTSKKVSAQRAYQLRHKAQGLCVLCDRPRCKESQNHCTFHRQAVNVKAREKARARNGAKTRYKGAVSYQMEKADAIRKNDQRTNSDD